MLRCVWVGLNAFPEKGELSEYYLALEICIKIMIVFMRI